MLLGGCFVADVVAQPPVDFSGRWRIEAAPNSGNSGNSGRPGAAPQRGDMGSGWGSTLAITQNATQLIVESIMYSNYDLQPQPRLTYALDGSESRNTLMMGRGLQELSSHARWEGTNLRITTVHSFTDPTSGTSRTMTVTQTLSLSSPTTLVIDVTRAGVLGGSPSTTKTVYTKS